MPQRDRPGPGRIVATWLIPCLLASGAQPGPEPPPTHRLRTNDVVALVGGANLVAGQEFGYLETLFATHQPGLALRFRSLAREGDTVFTQPRDVNYPGLPAQLDAAGATVVLIQFGQTEALAGTNRLGDFATAATALLDQLARPGRRLALVSPLRFDKPSSPMPDLSARNADLAAYVETLAGLARRRGIPFLDLFHPPPVPARLPRLTNNGLHLTPAGHWYHDWLLALQLGLHVAWDEHTVDWETGRLNRPEWEQVRQAVIAKNRLWFDYTRPMNWAFLGGDRIEQPSSRDHRDPKVRWFPAEMERFLPMIREADTHILRLATARR
ncbi:MAG TPA: GDSL-type esterase/lipase family protein [Methylomirabilota bacterium]|nr:GDSL-type esterase/lipase family protein [Methylomirabilota bacterium]